MDSGMSAIIDLYDIDTKGLSKYDAPEAKEGIV